MMFPMTLVTTPFDALVNNAGVMATPEEHTEHGWERQRHVDGTDTPPEVTRTPAQGAATSVLLAASPLLDQITGRYFANCRESPVLARRDPEDLSGEGVAPYALDPESAERLWAVTLRMLDAVS